MAQIAVVYVARQFALQGANSLAKPRRGGGEARLEYGLHLLEAGVTELLGETDEARRMGVALFGDRIDGFQGDHVRILCEEASDLLEPCRKVLVIRSDEIDDAFVVMRHGFLALRRSRHRHLRYSFHVAWVCRRGSPTEASRRREVPIVC